MRLVSSRRRAQSTRAGPGRDATARVLRRLIAPHTDAITRKKAPCDSFQYGWWISAYLRPRRHRSGL